VLGQRRFTHIQDDLTNKSIAQMSKLFKEVQELSMSLRMLPIKNSFQKMERIIRDCSKLLGKKVKLHLVGEETEVDKTVLEHIADPLVHIVRNAVDHGLEETEQRVEAGKDQTGNVEMMAFHEGNNLVIQITDDGKGIDPEVIKNKAIEKGIIQNASTMTDGEIIQLIFHPGFSTKDEVTDLSGRGVGMDVVKTNIENLGGEVKLASKLGEGSSLKIILPLTLAIIDGMVIRSGLQQFVLPLGQVFELIRLEYDDINNIPGVGQLFNIRGEVMPLFTINGKLGQKINSQNQSEIVIIIRGLRHAFGVSVDDVIGQQQIVIKKLGEDIRGLKGIMGSAIMGDGKPSFILDLYELFKDDLQSNKSYSKLLNANESAA
jgi:two-component system, chemotaxis family, sensor kinase CheA